MVNFFGVHDAFSLAAIHNRRRLVNDGNCIKVVPLDGPLTCFAKALSFGVEDFFEVKPEYAVRGRSNLLMHCAIQVIPFIVEDLEYPVPDIFLNLPDIIYRAQQCATVALYLYTKNSYFRDRMITMLVIEIVRSPYVFSEEIRQNLLKKLTVVGNIIYVLSPLTNKLGSLSFFGNLAFVSYGVYTHYTETEQMGYRPRENIKRFFTNRRAI